MSFVQGWRNALRGTLRSGLVWKALLVAMLLCALFVGTISRAWWNPQGRLDQVAVAIVNEDDGVTIPGGSAGGQRLSLGNKVAGSLRSLRSGNKSLLDWREYATRSKAVQAMDDGTVDMAIVIPTDFSTRLASVSTKKPQQATVEVIADQAAAGPFQVAMESALTTTVLNTLATRASAEAVAEVLAQQHPGSETSVAQSARAAALSQPIVVRQSLRHEVSRLGMSLGLMFLLLSLWIGGVLLTAAGWKSVPAAEETARGRAAAVLGRFVALVLPAAILGASAAAYLQILGFTMESVAVTYAVLVTTSLVFVAVDAIFAACLGAAGVFAAMILLPFQIASGGSLVSADLTPAFARVIAPLLPWTYSLHALRRAMFAGITVAGDLWALAVIAAVCLGAAMLIAVLRRRSAASG